MGGEEGDSKGGSWQRVMRGRMSFYDELRESSAEEVAQSGQKNGKSTTDTHTHTLREKRMQIEIPRSKSKMATHQKQKARAKTKDNNNNNGNGQQKLNAMKIK